tara:strand:- start:598 stop:909 length:312 start_codon:yes stop_codon:yes gene_type:complete
MSDKPPTPDFKETDKNIIFVGSKPLVNYIKSVNVQLIMKNSPEVIIKSRGKFISKAVDVAEVAKRNLEAEGVYLKEISIASEAFKNAEKTTNISTMEITLAKK